MGEQIVDVDSKPPRDLFESQQARIGLDSKLVKLKNLVPDSANLRGFLLGPAALNPQFTQSLSEAV